MCVCVCVYAHIHVYIHICSYIWIYARIHIYTYILGWFYRWVVVVCCFLDLLNMACNILVQFSVCFFSPRFVSVYVEDHYKTIDITIAWKKFRFILSVKSDFYMMESLSIAIHDLARRILLSISVDKRRWCQGR